MPTGLPDSESETIPGGIRFDQTLADVPATEAPTGEVDVQREMATRAGSFAAPRTAKPKSDPDEAETIVERGQTDAPGKTGAPLPGASAAASGTPALGSRDKPSRFTGRTGRDPAAGSAAARGSTPFAASGKPTTLAEGELLAERYELIERLGKGGMGEVWKAKHTLLQGMRAIKVIKASISRDPSFRQRFLQEGQTMMRVKHAGVVEVTDLDETRTNRELFMVMEYLKGRTVYDAIRNKEKPLSADVRNAVRVLLEIADGMQRIHDERIVHKDLKADNVLLVAGEDGLEHPKVIDFGLAKRLGDADPNVEKTDTGDSGKPTSASYTGDLHTTLSGTLAYMAPEQFRSEPSSFQSDIYALGVLAYEVFTNGEFPFPRGSLQQYLLIHKEGKVPEVVSKKCPHLDPDLTAILDKCLALRKEDRPESMRLVVKELEWWLGKPARAAARKKKVLIASGVSALLLFSTWAIFFSSRNTATLSGLKVNVGGVESENRYLKGDALATMQFTAGLKGKPDRPVFEIDSKSRPARMEASGDGTKFTAATDLSDLPDGEHVLAWRASADAQPTTFAFVVDRKAPEVRGVSVKDALVTPSGVYTKSDAPVVVVDVAEPPSGIESVYALAASGARSPGQAEEGTNRWLIKGTAPGQGKVEFDVFVSDRAGNVTKAHMAYVRDTEPPKVSLPDEFTSFETEKGKGHRGVFVRESVGAKLRVTVDEPSDVTVTFGTLPPVTRHADAPGDVSFDVPPSDVSLATTIVARDPSGNETRRDVPVDVMPDFVMIITARRESGMTLAGGTSDSIVLFRTYPIGEGLQLFSEPVRDASGATVADAVKSPLSLVPVRDSDEGKTRVFSVEAKDFADGVYRISASAEGNPTVRPLLLTVDSSPPAVDAVTVVDHLSREPIGKYALSAKVDVTATIADLSLARLTLGDKPPKETVLPGRHAYTFEMTLDHEGPTTWPLAMADGAGHNVERAITVDGDWTDPVIARLDEPVSGASVYDDQLVKFGGHCSEANYKLVVEGLPEGVSRAADCRTTDFSQEFQLPATGRPVELSVVAVDLAGHHSKRVPLTITVIHREKVLPAKIDWREAPHSVMRKVEPGAVLIGRRVEPVRLVFLDRTEVTNREYREFLAATKGQRGDWCHPDEPKGWDHTPVAATWTDPKWNADGLPVVNVSWWDAYAYAKWSGRRLPTEGEWVKAAASGDPKTEAELRTWPPFAGTAWKAGVLATAESVKGPVAADSGEDLSPAGCLHMGGNVSEWVERPDAPAGEFAQGTRGGNWFYTRAAADVRNTPMKGYDRSFRAPTIGFRCAVDGEAVQP
jgi:serine/threonine protein kinase